MLKIKNRSVVNEIPNKQNIKTKLSPEINSTKKYFTFILVEHSMHRALRIIKDNVLDRNQNQKIEEIKMVY